MIRIKSDSKNSFHPNIVNFLENIQSDKNDITTLSISTISNEYQKKTHSELNGEGETIEDRIDNFKNGSVSSNPLNLNVTNSHHQLINNVRPKLVTQVLCAIIVSITQVGTGAVVSFSGVVLPQLTIPNSEDIYLNPTYAALFGSVITLGAAFGGLLSGLAVEKLGHCKTLLLAQPLNFSFWLILAFTSNPLLIVAARIALGIMMGLINTSSAAYMLEITHKDLRGILFAFIPTARQVGFLFVSILGITPLTWREMALVIAITTTIFPFIGLLFFPKSPRWLAAHGFGDEAKKSLIFFRGKIYDSEAELKDIMDEVRKNDGVKGILIQLKQLFQRGDQLKPMLILLFISAFGNFHGAGTVNSYLVIIFQDSSLLDSYTSAMLVGVIRVVGTLCYLALIDRVGRRPLHIYSYFAISLCLAIMGGYFFIKDLGWGSSILDWLQISVLLVYTFFIALGLPVLNIIQGELISTNVRSLGMSILTFVMFFSSFSLTQAYFLMEEAVGKSGTFWIYSTGSFFVAAISHFALLETNGKSLEDISKLKDIKKPSR